MPALCNATMRTGAACWRTALRRSTLLKTPRLNTFDRSSMLSLYSPSRGLSMAAPRFSSSALSESLESSCREGLQPQPAASEDPSFSATAAYDSFQNNSDAVHAEPSQSSFGVDEYPELLKSLNEHVSEEASPEKLVSALSIHIVGQEDAKRSLAIALRDRWRRQQLTDPELRAETTPNNILLIGPSGCGKTELARRIAQITHAPFVKVVATKYTEVGFVGDDTQSMIHDLVDQAIADEKRKKRLEVTPEARLRAEETIVKELQTAAPYQALDADILLQEIRAGSLNNVDIELESEMLTVPTDRPTNPLQQLFDSMATGSGGRTNGGSSVGGLPPNFAAIPVGVSVCAAPDGFLKQFGFDTGRSNKEDKKKTARRKLPIGQALPLLEDHFAAELIDQEEVMAAAKLSTENRGIIFIDEFDKLVDSKDGNEFRAKRRGVQKELLSLMDGTSINTRLGRISTEHILFVASGAFLSSKPSDVMPELQGRLPIRSELKPLTVDDLVRILTETKFNLIKQQIALLKTEGIYLEFTPNAIRRIAQIAHELNTVTANIGARRLKTVIAKVLDDIKFSIDTYKKKKNVLVDEEMVLSRLESLREQADLTKYII